MYAKSMGSPRVKADTYHVATLAELKADPIFKVAAQRPLTKDEVTDYLRVKERISSFDQRGQSNSFFEF